MAVVRVRSRHPVNLVVGPPEHKEDDVRMMNLFFGKEGTKIVCGLSLIHIFTVIFLPRSAAVTL